MMAIVKFYSPPHKNQQPTNHLSSFIQFPQFHLNSIVSRDRGRGQGGMSKKDNGLNGFL